MARDFLREWNDSARIEKERARAANQVMDTQTQEALLDAQVSAGIPLVEVPETAQDVLGELVQTAVSQVQGPVKGSQEAPEQPGEPSDDALADSIWNEAPTLDAWSEIREGIEAAPLPDLERKDQTPEFEDLADETEDRQFDPIPESFSPQERRLVEYHRETLRMNEQLDDEKGTTTVYITGVQGPDGREYLIPGYFAGQRQSPEASALRASLIGWDKYPSYKSPEEAQNAVNRLHTVIEGDMVDDGTVMHPAKVDTTDPQKADAKEEQEARQVPVGSNEPITKRQPTAERQESSWRKTEMPEKLTRGLRNNNPGNVRKNPKFQWQGQRQGDDPDFVSFNSPEMGIRALARVIRTYRSRHGLNNVTGIISRWAPPNENDTELYIQSVADKLGVDPGEELDFSNTQMTLDLVKAIIYHENGAQPYSDSTIMTGIKLSGLLGGNI